MSEMKYPNHRLNDVFGYCARGLKGESVMNQYGHYVNWRTGTVKCEENWQECQDYKKFSEVIKVEVLEPAPAAKSKKK